VIYSSSTAVYGYQRGGEVITEESKPLPANHYGESKLMGEQVIKAFAAANDRIKYTILRIAVIYGPGYSSPFDRVFDMLMQGKMRTIGSGDNRLSLVHLDDVVDAIMDCSESKKSQNKLYNLSDGERYTQKGLLAKAAKMLGTEYPKAGTDNVFTKLLAVGGSFNKSQMQFLTSDRIICTAKIRGELGIVPKRSIDVEGKAMADEFMKQHRMTVRGKV